MDRVRASAKSVASRANLPTSRSFFRPMKKLLALLWLCTAAGTAALSAADPVVRFHTTLGDIDVELYPDVTPRTVANFLGYVNRGDYDGSIVHRSAPRFVIQGGGYYINSTVQYSSVPTQAPVVNEPHYSNVRGTIAMAKLGGDPNSATSQWFFNLANNTADPTNLDTQNGGFTVFGKVRDDASQAVVDAIAALQVINAGSPFDQLPVINYGGGTLKASNFCYVNSVLEQPAPDFFRGEVALDNGVYFLTFPNGTPFGYYSYLSDAHYLFHFDLGYEYVYDAQDGEGGVYLYDFDSDSFFYTSPTFPFPYLYDFDLRAVLYYYAEDNNGNYTSNPRYFYNFRTGEIITK